MAAFLLFFGGGKVFFLYFFAFIGGSILGLIFFFHDFFFFGVAGMQFGGMSSQSSGLVEHFTANFADVLLGGFL